MAEARFEFIPPSWRTITPLRRTPFLPARLAFSMVDAAHSSSLYGDGSITRSPPRSWRQSILLRATVRYGRCPSPIRPRTSALSGPLDQSTRARGRLIASCASALLKRCDFNRRASVFLREDTASLTVFAIACDRHRPSRRRVLADGGSFGDPSRTRVADQPIAAFPPSSPPGCFPLR